MATHPFRFVFLTAAALWLGAMTGCAGLHHDHGGHAAGELTLNNGKRWTSDEPLRLGMSKIRDALEAELPSIHSGTAGDDRYNALADAINKDVAYMVENCKLDKQTDAMLHRVLADILAGTDAMQGKDKRLNRQGGALKIARALDNYGRYFDHPGWRPLNIS